MSAGTERYPAPAVVYPLARSQSLAAALLVLHLLSLVVLWAWLLQGAGAQHLALVTSVVVWLASAAMAARFWASQPIGSLAWGGAGWQLHRTAHPIAVQALGSAVIVQLDAQRQMALVFPGAHPSVWLLVEKKRQGERWPELRRAVYSRPDALRPASATLRRKGQPS